MARVDLDARRAQQEQHVVVLDGHEYLLAAQLPLIVAEQMIAGNFTRALNVMFGDQADEVVDKIALDDLLAIARDCYGLDAGESEASSPPSANNGKRSTPTSNGSTRSTLPRPVSGLPR